MPTRRKQTQKAKKTRTSHGHGQVQVQGHGSIYGAIVPTFLGLLNSIKMYHWRTTSFATHKATDELYGQLNSKIDTFVETLLGRQSRARILTVGRTLAVKPVHTNAELKKTIEGYKEFLMRLSTNKEFNVAANTDLLALRDEILATVNQFLYLLTLA